MAEESFSVSRKKSYRFWNGVFVCLIILISYPTFALTECPLKAAMGDQPFPGKMAVAFNRAGANQLGAEGPTYDQLYKGYPNPIFSPPYVPPILIKAIGYVESGGWKQFKADYGEAGPTVISFDCGYGIMQITSGMAGGEGFDPSRVASEYAYNIGTGAKILIDKWNKIHSYIGERNPEIIEDWYYAVWAYNGWVPSNNPNNAKYKPDRPPFDGTQPRVNYPYQELVWGYAANPPSTEFWKPIPLTLPNRSFIGNRPPMWIQRSYPFHSEIAVLSGGLKNDNKGHVADFDIELGTVTRMHSIFSKIRQQKAARSW